MSAIFYQPWIGSEYIKARDHRVARLRDVHASAPPSGRGLPIHVMAESHYGEPHEHEPGNTIRIMHECAFAPSRCSSFFTKIANVVRRALNEEDHSADWRREVWERLAFSNYLQVLLPRSRQAPTRDQLSTGHASFFEQLASTAPPILLVVSYRLWERLPTWDRAEAGPIESRGPGSIQIDHSYVYTYAVGNAVCWTHAICIPHPSSSAFNLEDAAGRLTTALLAQPEMQDRFGRFDDDGELRAPRPFGTA